MIALIPSPAVVAHRCDVRALVLDLPQPLKYEAQLKGIKDQEQREKVQRLVQPERK